MVSFDTITRLVVGSAAAERSEKKRLERMYEGVEASLKLITEVTRPSPPASSTESICGTSACSGELRARNEAMAKEERTLKRALSTPTVATFPVSASLDELKRTHSESHFGVVLPELPRMTGFGKYRRGVNASPAWQLAHLEKNYINDGDIIADFLGDQPPFGMDPEIWRQYRTTKVQQIKDSRLSGHHIFPSSRQNSFVVTPPGSRTPVTDASSQYTDPMTGTKVVRGFTVANSATISNASSAASAGKSCWTPLLNHKRKPISNLTKALSPIEMPSNAGDCAIESDGEDDGDDNWVEANEDEDDD